MMRAMNFELCWKTRAGEGVESETHEFAFEGTGFIGFSDVHRWAKSIIDSKNARIHCKSKKLEFLDLLFVDYPEAETETAPTKVATAIVKQPSHDDLYLAALKAQRCVAMAEVESLPAGSGDTKRLHILYNIIDDLNREMNTLEVS